MANYYGSSVVPSLVGMKISPVAGGWLHGLADGETMTVSSQLENTDGTFQVIGQSESGREIRTRASSLTALKKRPLELCRPEGMGAVEYEVL